jgi:hypothetical protein
MLELTADPSRVEEYGGTGILVRAKLGGVVGNYDIAELDKASLLAWLRSRGGDNPWAEDVVGILLGHGYLHEPKDVRRD